MCTVKIRFNRRLGNFHDFRVASPSVVEARVHHCTMDSDQEMQDAEMQDSEMSTLSSLEKGKGRAIDKETNEDNDNLPWYVGEKLHVKGCAESVLGWRSTVL